jgi:hypothetical protein
MGIVAFAMRLPEMSPEQYKMMKSGAGKIPASITTTTKDINGRETEIIYNSSVQTLKTHRRFSMSNASRIGSILIFSLVL